MPRRDEVEIKEEVSSTYTDSYDNTADTAMNHPVYRCIPNPYSLGRRKSGPFS